MKITLFSCYKNYGKSRDRPELAFRLEIQIPFLG